MPAPQTQAPPPVPRAPGAGSSPPAPPPPPLLATLPPPVAPRRGWSKTARLLVALPLALILAAGVVLIVQSVLPHPTRDARNAMRDARGQVSRSFAPAADASRHTMSLLRANSFARNRRTAIADLDRVVALRRRAIARLGDVPSNAHVSYRRIRRAWQNMLRNSVADARALRDSLAALRARDLTTGLVAVERGTGFRITSKTAAMPIRLTSFVGADLTLRRFDAELRDHNPWIR